MFLDEATIKVIGGNGGKGCVSWRREKYVPYGGPNGGDGGNGGNVIVIADANSDTLSDYQSRKKFQAVNGEAGSGQNRHGRAGEDKYLLVPPGTVVMDITDDAEKPVVIADLSHKGEQVVVARGGKGGFGNAHFKTATRQAPDFAELGEPGEERNLKLELKLVADIGIIGYPSVGKSSLIAAVSKARPKIADYPFTTLIPNLGVVRVSDREFVLCDVPGLIEGASEGKGLGDKFLKHIERCGVLIHLLDLSRDDIISDYRNIRKELKAYSPALGKKKEFVVLNKLDLAGMDASPWMSALKKEKIKVFAGISAATHHGTDQLMKALLPEVLKEKEMRQTPEADVNSPEELPVLRPHLLSKKMGAYKIEKTGEIVRVIGKRVEQFTKMTNFNQIGGRKRFMDVIERIGLKKALDREVKPSDRIFIGDQRIDEYL
ncbi:hypothetical protein A3A67_00825 [Candidatus Peribacteria bacterium RIFCSPLOWO2_01_FULL_51_18]|nr:MAG: hypothetical protein A3A67_00825 [Candidatus Peribacteria bacterium RIFCSPLOWO2_01_FULL_51_18]